jgi:hypothetical protein
MPNRSTTPPAGHDADRLSLAPGPTSAALALAVDTVPPKRRTDRPVENDLPPSIVDAPELKQLARLLGRAAAHRHWRDTLTLSEPGR